MSIFEEPIDCKQYFDCDKGWKLTEQDKDFLIQYYNDYINFLYEDCCESRDSEFVKDVLLILDSIKERGVEASKNLIQCDAIDMADCVHWEIYEYYDKDSSKDIIYLIENSILNV